MISNLKYKKNLFLALFLSIIFFKICLIFSLNKNFENKFNNLQNRAETIKNEEIVAEKLDFEIIKEHSHSPQIFVQGLEFINGKLYESGGLYEKSGIYINQKGKTSKVTDVSPHYFAEGLTFLDKFLYQLTWRDNKILFYTLNDLSKPISELNWPKEGWGATNDGKNLIISDGSEKIYFLKLTFDEKNLPNGYEIFKTLDVKWDGKLVKNLNELEFIDGKIWANIWQENKIIVINSQTGNVENFLDAENLATSLGLKNDEKNRVLNGIAKNKTTGNIFLTGKFWPIMFEIKIKNPD